MSSTSGMIVYLVFIIAIFYFMAIRPQSKEKEKNQAELMATVAVGDSVLTSSGFYGVIIDMTDDTVIANGHGHHHEKEKA